MRWACVRVCVRVRSGFVRSGVRDALTEQASARRRRGRDIPKRRIHVVGALAQRKSTRLRTVRSKVRVLHVPAAGVRKLVKRPYSECGVCGFESRSRQSTMSSESSNLRIDAFAQRRSTQIGKATRLKHGCLRVRLSPAATILMPRYANWQSGCPEMAVYAGSTPALGNPARHLSSIVDPKRTSNASSSSARAISRARALASPASSPSLALASRFNAIARKRSEPESPAARTLASA
jgi:hypothetical protein